MIRAEQLQVFSDYLLEDFLSRMAGVLGADFPATLGRQSFSQRKEYARIANRVAIAHGITSAQDVEEMIRLAVGQGIDLAAEPPDWGLAAGAMLDPDLTPGLKLRRLSENAPKAVHGGSFKL